MEAASSGSTEPTGPSSPRRTARREGILNWTAAIPIAAVFLAAGLWKITDPVGAAVLTLDGQIYTGCNVENISYGLSVCAERTALFKAVSGGCRDFAAMAVVGGDKRPAAPCGACRQALAEFCPPETPVFIARLKKGGKVTAATLCALLPLSFASLA